MTEIPEGVHPYSTHKTCNPSPFKVSRYSGKDEVMPNENKTPEFELSGSRPAPLPLLAFMVGDCDWVAAVDEAGARRVLEEMNGEEPGAYGEWEVELVSDEWLDKPWCDEDDRTKIVGTLRKWLAAATEPAYLAGTE